MTTLLWRVLGLALLPLIFLLEGARGQALRDPTRPPSEAGLTSAEPGAKALRVEPSAMTIIVREGRPFLAVGTRLYAKGEKLGQARIERIAETEVWLREGGVLRKVSIFSGVQRSTVKSTPVPTTRTPTP
jgi:hypothetical protein